MSMTLEEMKLAVCNKIPHVVGQYQIGVYVPAYSVEMTYVWKEKRHETWVCEVWWPTEGLQVCHEAERKLNTDERDKYWRWLGYVVNHQHRMATNTWLQLNATYEQKLEALCRVWYPERFR